MTPDELKALFRQALPWLVVGAILLVLAGIGLLYLIEGHL